MDIKPKVSICIPFYNGALHLMRVIGCALGQTYENIEIVLVDDCSSDNSYSIAKKALEVEPRIRLYRNEKNLGIGGNWNKCLQYAEGEFICIWHQDDLYSRFYVEQSLIFFYENSEIGAVFSGVYFINKFNRVLGKSRAYNKDLKSLIFNKEILIKSLLHDGNRYLNCSTGLFKSEVFKKVGLFNESLKYSLDIDMWLRIVEYYKISLNFARLVAYRISFDQTTMTYKKNIKTYMDYFDILDRLIDENPELLVFEERVAKQKFKDLCRLYLNQTDSDFIEFSVLLSQNFVKSKLYERIQRRINLLQIFGLYKFYVFFLLFQFKAYKLVKRLSLSHDFFFLKKIEY